MGIEDLPQELSHEQLKSDCQERWDQPGGMQKAEDVQPSALPQPQPGTAPTPEQSVTAASGTR
jgi:hypothetical protein